MLLENLILFSSSQCLPCKFLKERLEKEGYKIRVVLIDDEENYQFTEKYKIRSLPTVVNKNTMEQIVGNTNINRLIELNEGR